MPWSSGVITNLTCWLLLLSALSLKVLTREMILTEKSWKLLLLLSIRGRNFQPPAQKILLNQFLNTMSNRNYPFLKFKITSQIFTLNLLLSHCYFGIHLIFFVETSNLLIFCTKYILNYHADNFCIFVERIFNEQNAESFW